MRKNCFLILYLCLFVIGCKHQSSSSQLQQDRLEEKTFPIIFEIESLEVNTAFSQLWTDFAKIYFQFWVEQPDADDAAGKKWLMDKMASRAPDARWPEKDAYPLKRGMLVFPRGQILLPTSCKPSCLVRLVMMEADYNGDDIVWEVFMHWKEKNFDVMHEKVLTSKPHKTRIWSDYSFGGFTGEMTYRIFKKYVEQ